MAKATVKVDVPDSVLEEAAQKELKELRSKVTKLENRVRLLESREDQVKQEKKEVQRYRDAWESIRHTFADTFDLYVEQYYDGY